MSELPMRGDATAEELAAILVALHTLTERHPRTFGLLAWRLTRRAALSAAGGTWCQTLQPAEDPR